MAEAALLTALIGPTIKLRWKLSLQIRGDGPARLIATDYYAPAAEGAPGRIRAYASFDETRLDPDADPFPQIGHGYFAVLIDQGKGTTPYSGLTPIAGGSLADCAQTYFAQSEQLPTRFALSFDKDRRRLARGRGDAAEDAGRAAPADEDGGSARPGPAHRRRSARRRGRVRGLVARQHPARNRRRPTS